VIIFLAVGRRHPSREAGCQEVAQEPASPLMLRKGVEKGLYSLRRHVLRAGRV